ncbi:ABC transporter substrate-binding protein [Vibrio europaeus]|uniref:ABC transporter substrate-binding protein n=1 Tax=Vibrio europaeus TaxID=300876 RepID=UPI00233F1C3B|nr:ABC transporter substrate-binding protein [Vibrio europaeus]MDC5720693.1 ABC transporter substrate-binding protein [Vibrio europaeus]MDC5755411.1 ABC transporter substrate-binding protein [Vibrio europaeus]MDC5775990.1 ABC transporter substrate-binding protein [Vibrio europaeus]MDC5795128.1 ABC transporter substrate-binding protein [Vibrio europaeus]MDC5799699.1 ABC transporter substrate-binding protein [Vibrio europaeus]
MKSRIFALAAIAVVAALGMSQFNQSESQPALKISGPFEFSSQDLSKDGYMFTRMQVVESLVAINNKGQVEPQLAAAWSVSADDLIWTFTLRDDVIFHDGAKFDAAAAKLALENAMAKPGVIKRVPISQITAQGNQLTLELSKPYNPMLTVLAHYTVAIASPSSYNEEGIATSLSGTGPYQIEELIPPHKIHVTRYDNYWGQKANIEKVQYLAGHRAESRALLAQTGQADIVYTLDPASVSPLQQTDSVEVVRESIPRTILLKINNEHKYLNSPQTRQALSLALDRSGISQQIIRMPGSEAYQLFAPSLGAWHIEHFSQTSRDLNKAQQLLVSQGWQADEQGMLQRDGQGFVVNLTTYSDRPELPLVATAIQAQLKEIGIQVEISIDNSSAIPAKHQDGTIELGLVARNFGATVDPLALLLKDFAQHKGSDWGPTNWSSPEFSQLLNRLSATKDPASYQQHAQQAAHILANEMPLIPITFYTQLVAVNKKVGNFAFDPFEINYRISEMTLND